MSSRIDSEAAGKPLHSFYELLSFLNNIMILYHIYETIISLKSHRSVL